MKARHSFVGALRVFALPVVAASLLGACASAIQPASETSKAPPPAAAKQPIPRLVPSDQPANLGDIERFAWQQVSQLGASFAAGDVAGFLAKVSPGFYRGYGTLETSLKALMAKTSDRAAVVAIRLVTEEEGKVSVSAEWTRSVRYPDGSVDARHGETVFLFHKGDKTLRLLDYRGDAPFAIDGI